MAELWHLGVDASSTGVGVVLLTGHGYIHRWHCWQDTKPSMLPQKRVYEIGQFAERFLWDARMQHEVGLISCSMEASISRGKGTVVLVKAQGAIESRWDVEWGSYYAHQTKATAHETTGVKIPKETKAAKLAMIEAFKLRTGPRPTMIDCFTDTASQFPNPRKALEDLVDAFWVAETDRLAAASTRQEHP